MNIYPKYSGSNYSSKAKATPIMSEVSSSIMGPPSPRNDLDEMIKELDMDLDEMINALPNNDLMQLHVEHVIADYSSWIVGYNLGYRMLPVHHS